MQQLTHAGEDAVNQLAQRYGVSPDAVKTLLFAVAAGGGTMAQFHHAELGGGGQWMRGGMTMVGDMFNSGLQQLVANLCTELSNLLAGTQVFAPQAPASSAFGGGYAQSSSWPAELGVPSSSGGQNDTRYAYFPGTRRLAVMRGAELRVYDALDHQIGGVQQQQGSGYGDLSFSSQYGTFTVDSLPLVSGPAGAESAPPWTPPAEQWSAPAPEVPVQATSSNTSQDAIFGALEKLASLHQMGVISEDEFRAKKAELLARL